MASEKRERKDKRSVCRDKAKLSRTKELSDGVWLRLLLPMKWLTRKRKRKCRTKKRKERSRRSIGKRRRKGRNQMLRNRGTMNGRSWRTMEKAEMDEVLK